MRPSWTIIHLFSRFFRFSPWYRFSIEYRGIYGRYRIEVKMLVSEQHYLVGMCNSPTKKPLGPIPQNPPEVRNFNFSLIFEQTPPRGFVACTSKLVSTFRRWNLRKVVLFAVVFEQTPPRGFVRSASTFFSTLRRWNLRKVVLLATLRRRAWPWHAVKVGHFEFSGIFFRCWELTPPRDFVCSASKLISTVRRWC